jgi:hypothetical protein
MSLRKNDIIYNVLDQYTGENVTYNKVTTFADGTAMADGKCDGVIYRKIGEEYFKRSVDGPINVKWFGAKGDGVQDDTESFTTAIAFSSSLSLKSTILIPEGRYKINQKLAIDGGISGSAPYIIGAGGRSTILDFSTATGNTAIQWGTNATGSAGRDTLHGGIKGIRVIANSNMDGLTIASYAPTSNAFNRFEDLFFTNVRDGVNELTSPNASSNYSNHFENINVQGHSRIAFRISGVYSTYKGIFLVGPQGAGDNTLSLMLEGAGNTIESIQTEDQVYILGRSNQITHLSMEYILKTVQNSVIGKNAIRISNTNNHIDGLTMTGFKNTVIDTLASMTGANHSIRNAVYFDEGNPLYKITYPFFPTADSTGIMENISVDTEIYLDNPSLEGYLVGWSLQNIKNATGIFSRDPNLRLQAVSDPTKLSLTGGRVTGAVNLDFPVLGRPTTGTGSVELWGEVYHICNHRIPNKASDNYLPFILRNTSGPEAVMDLVNIGTINGSPVGATTGGFSGTTANDIEITDATKGVILKTADGIRARITLVNTGTTATPNLSLNIAPL